MSLNREQLPTFVLGLAVALVASVVFMAPQPQTQEAIQTLHEDLAKVSNAVGTQLIREQVLELPEDGQSYYTTLLYANKTADAPSRQLAAMVASTPRLQQLVAQTKVFQHVPTDWVFQQRYSQSRLPAIIVQDPRGKVIYHASGDNLPMDGETLADEIQLQLGQCTPDGCGPAGPLRPENFLKPRPIPDIRPSSGPLGGGSPIMAFALILGALALGVMQQRPTPEST